MITVTVEDERGNLLLEMTGKEIAALETFTDAMREVFASMVARELIQRIIDLDLLDLNRETHKSPVGILSGDGL